MPLGHLFDVAGLLEGGDFSDSTNVAFVMTKRLGDECPD
jgi:hypothetical protein